jgi:hypothetical protein
MSRKTKRVSASNASRVRIRKLRVSDISFIQNLAVRTPGYSVCPAYLLWALSRFQQELCVVAETKRKRERLGFMLALQTGIRSNTVFVWQLASTVRGQRMRAGLELACYLRDIMRKHQLRKIAFTTVPNSATERSLRTLARQAFGRSPTITRPLPKAISRGENEFLLEMAQ